MRCGIAAAKAIEPVVSFADPVEGRWDPGAGGAGSLSNLSRPKGKTPRGLSFYMAVLAFADVSVMTAFVVARAFASPVASAVAGHMLVTSVSERAIESIADAGCFVA